MKGLGKRIAFLCTGDEIVDGEILDTNAPHFAEQLIAHHFIPGTRLIVSDDQKEMEKGIRYLLQDHSVLITLGGLGPTSDDRTRFAVSSAIESPLEFDQACWDHIVEMFHRLHYADIPENNRQQCLFPAGAEIYPNANGTAAACCITKSEKLIFMLPGPPNECCPIFDQHVLPRLLKTNWQEDIYRRSWMLLGVSEGQIAEELDSLTEDSACDIGYRVSYPYLEVKLRSTNKTALAALAPKLEAKIQDKLISRDKQTASELFFLYLQSTTETISILDHVTQGRLAATLLWPKVYNRLYFNKKESDIHVKLEGLNEYWQNKPAESTEMQIYISKNRKNIEKQVFSIPMRGEGTLRYAVEQACHYLLETLR